MSTDCARPRITSAALTSAWWRAPHATCPQCEHSYDENLGFTRTTLRPASSAADAFQPPRRRSEEKIAIGIERLAGAVRTYLGR